MAAAAETGTGPMSPSNHIAPLDALGIIPALPLSHWGWGNIPDQYGRRWAGDDGESPPPANPGVSDLPPLRPWWGERE